MSDHDSIRGEATKPPRIPRTGSARVACQPSGTAPCTSPALINVKGVVGDGEIRRSGPAPAPRRRGRMRTPRRRPGNRRGVRVSAPRSLNGQDTSSASVGPTREACQATSAGGDSSRWPCRRGMQNAARVPPPGRSTHITPPCSTTSCRARWRPVPTPAFSLCRMPSPVENGWSKALLATSRSRPRRGP